MSTGNFTLFDSNRWYSIQSHIFPGNPVFALENAGSVYISLQNTSGGSDLQDGMKFQFFGIPTFGPNVYVIREKQFGQSTYLAVQGPSGGSSPVMRSIDRILAIDDVSIFWELIDYDDFEDVKIAPFYMTSFSNGSTYLLQARPANIDGAGQMFLDYNQPDIKFSWWFTPFSETIDNPLFSDAPLPASLYAAASAASSKLYATSTSSTTATASAGASTASVTARQTTGATAATGVATPSTTGTSMPTPTPTPVPAPGLSGGQIAGIIIGVIAFFALVVAGSIFAWRRQRRRQEPVQTLHEAPAMSAASGPSGASKELHHEASRRELDPDAYRREMDGTPRGQKTPTFQRYELPTDR